MEKNIGDKIRYYLKGDNIFPLSIFLIIFIAIFNYEDAYECFERVGLASPIYGIYTSLYSLAIVSCLVFLLKVQYEFFKGKKTDRFTRKRNSIIFFGFLIIISSLNSSYDFIKNIPLSFSDDDSADELIKNLTALYIIASYISLCIYVFDDRESDEIFSKNTEDFSVTKFFLSRFPFALIKWTSDFFIPTVIFLVVYIDYNESVKDIVYKASYYSYEKIVEHYKIDDLFNKISFENFIYKEDFSILKNGGIDIYYCYKSPSSYKVESLSN